MTLIPSPLRLKKTASEAMHTWQFQSLWWVFFINITCGIGLLAVLSPMAQDVIGMSAQEAAAFVGIIGIMNGGGRILWSTISDRLSRPVTYILFFALEILALDFIAIFCVLFCNFITE